MKTEFSENVILSICISSYNKGQKCIDLINKILKLDDDRIDIIVCDDCSDEDTVNMLRNLHVSKVKVFFNQSNIGACPNWYETIDHGDGKYLLHVLDRDYIDISVLNDLLDRLEHSNIGIGYIGNLFACPAKRKTRQIYESYRPGEDTASEIGGIPLHPTGFFISRDIWKSNDFKKYFYNEMTYGIYPHSYLMGIVGLHNEILLVRRNFCRYVYSQTSKSLFYRKKRHVRYWWEPGRILDTSIKMIYELCRYFKKDQFKAALVENVFADALFRGTIGYQTVVFDKRQMAHYSKNTQKVTLNRLLAINFVYTVRYLFMKNKLGLGGHLFCLRILKASLDNVKNISGSYKKIITRLKDENIKKQEFYNVFYEWMKIHNSGRKLSEYFMDHGYRRIAVYGMMELGELICDELNGDGNVSVEYVIDRDKRGEYKGLCVLSPDDDLPDIDVIVVTAIHYLNEIEEAMKDRVKCPIISLEDVVYGM